MLLVIAGLLASLGLASGGCQSSGSREYQPGKGWTPN